MATTMSTQAADRTPDLVDDTLISGVLENVLPGFGVGRRLVLDHFHVDLTWLVSGMALAMGVSAVWRYAIKLLKSHMEVSVSIESREQIYLDMLVWLQQNVIEPHNTITPKSSGLGVRLLHGGHESIRNLQASTSLRMSSFSSRIRGDDDSDDDNTITYSPARNGDAIRFSYKGRYFWISLAKSEGNNMSYYAKESMTISTLGLDTAPIKQLISHSHSVHQDQRRGKTSIRCVDIDGVWSETMTRPSRPLNTIYMDEEMKRLLLTDATRFAAPNSPKWYSHRGIPYRRGYLFWGPPGTGKTSLSSALAGHLGYELHLMNLADPSLTDKSLRSLFTELSPKSVVLLEDIDSIGLLRRNFKSEGTLDYDSNAVPAATDTPGKL